MLKTEFIERFFPGKTEEEVDALELKYGDLRTAACKESPEAQKLFERGFFICEGDDCFNVTDVGVFLSHDGPFYPLQKGISYLCKHCFEDNNAHGIPGTVYVNGKKYRFTLGDVVLTTFEEEISETIYKWLMELAKRKTYARIDDWRGYRTFQKNSKILKCVINSSIAIDGMTFGNDDDAAMLKLKELLEDDKIFEPMIVTFPPTSNVCVTGVEVWVPSGFVKKFKKFLKLRPS